MLNNFFVVYLKLKFIGQLVFYLVTRSQSVLPLLIVSSGSMRGGEWRTLQHLEHSFSAYHQQPFNSQKSLPPGSLLGEGLLCAMRGHHTSLMGTPGALLGSISKSSTRSGSCLFGSWCPPSP